MPLTTAPATPEPKKKTHRWETWAIGISLVIIALIGGELARQAIFLNDEPTNTYVGPTGTEVIDPVTPTNDSNSAIVTAATEATVWTNQAVDDLTAAQQAAEVGDVQLAASSMYSAAADYAKVADIWRGVDSYVTTTADAIAQHLYQVADEISNYRFTRATSGLYDAMDDMDALTQYVDGLA